LAPMEGGSPVMATDRFKTELASGGVLVYCTEVPSLSLSSIARLNARLSSDEQNRAARFTFERDRAVFVVAHALLRHSLGLIFEETAIRFRTNAYGKPELDLPFDHDVRFNLSHTRGMAVCAICRGHAIGVDVEAIDRSIDVEVLARQYFAGPEHRLIMMAASQHRVEIFFRFWTLKEAMVKAIGTGLSLPLKEFAFTLEPLSLNMSPVATDWHVWEYAPTAIHRVALAVRPTPGLTVNVASRLITLKEIL
jgi:4'-phosphopantetheinyl transferase